MTTEALTSFDLPKPLTRAQYESAISAIENGLTNAKASYPVAEGARLLTAALRGAMNNAPGQSFRPFDEGTIFFKQCATSFSEQILFHSPNLAGEALAYEVLRLLAFVHTFVYENMLKSVMVTEFDSRVITFVNGNLSSFPEPVRFLFEFLKSRLITTFAIDQQAEVRSKIATQTENAFNRLGALEEKIEGWNSELSTWTTKSEALREFIEKQHSKLNFVGLASAFLELINRKKVEATVQRVSLAVLAVLLICVPAYSAFRIFSIEPISVTTVQQWIAQATPVAAIEILLLYFFRIALRNFYSVKAQLLQLDLRYALCAFIEGYAKFAKGVKSGTEDKTLEKFETIVFSGITADIQNIPSQFDGIEQLTSIIKSIRGKD